MSTFLFMLPKIRDKGLLTDDSERYILNTLPKNYICESVALLMKNMINSCTQWNFKTSKRVDVFMEFYAVTLTLDPEYAEYMQWVANLYQRWIIDPSFLGNAEKQNKYFRLIIKHLSIPFQNVNFPSDGIKFYNVLVSILDTYRTLVQTHGSILEDESWKTLIMTILAICDQLNSAKESRSVTSDHITKLQTKALYICFYLLFSTPEDNSYFDVFLKFSVTWSTVSSYIIAWGNWIVPAYELILHKNFNSPRLEYLSKQEIHQIIMSIECSRLPSALQFLLNAVDYDIAKKDDKVSIALVNVAAQAAAASFQLAIDNSKGKNTLRFPLKPFLHLFGKIIYGYSIKTLEFVDVINKAILWIISNFDFTGCEKEIQDLVDIINRQYQKSIQLVRGMVQAMSRPLPEAVFVSLGATSLATIDSLQLPDINNEEFIIPLFLSACNATKKYQTVHFMKLWDNSKRFQSRLQLISQSFNYDINIGAITQKALTSDNLELLEMSLWLALAYAMSVRENAHDCRSNSQALECVVDFALQHHLDGDCLAVILLSCLESINWGMPSFPKLNALLDYTLQIQNETSPVKYAKSLAKLILWRSSCNEISPDMSCELFASSGKKEDVEKSEFVVVGDSILLSFNKKNEKEVEIIARGPFGKTSFIATDDNFGKIIPKFMTMPEEQIPLNQNDLYGTQYEVDEYKDLPKPDQKIIDDLTWMKKPIRQVKQNHETSIYEFLVKCGLLTSHNLFNIKHITDKTAASRAIDMFQKTESNPVLFVPILHMVPGETELNFSRQKTTANLKAFLNGIAPIFIVNQDNEQSSLNIKFKQGLPLIPGAANSIGFICPEIAETDEDAKKVKDIYDSTKVRIIFDEADTKFGDLKNEPHFVIRPLQRGCYLVETGLKDQCFAPMQLMTAKSFSQALIMFVERRVNSFNSTNTIDTVTVRTKIVSQLVSKPADEFPLFD